MIDIINIISLPERKDRQHIAKQEFVSQGVMFGNGIHFWDGIKSQFTFNGVRMAHQQIVRYAKEKKMDSVLIAEDDIKFLGKGAFAYYLMNTPDDYDIYLGGIFGGEILPDNTVKNGDFSGLTLYTIHSRFYDTFLDIRKVGHLDRLLKGLGKYVVCNPMVVSQYEGWSDNHQKLVHSYDERLTKYNLYSNPLKT